MQGEISVPGTPVGAVYLAVEREHQCYGVFGHGIGRIGRYPDYRDAVLGGGFQIDVVETRAAQGDQPYTHAGQLPDGWGIRRVIDEDADRIGALCQGYVVDVQVAAVVFDPYPVVGVDPVERFAVVGLCPEKMVFMAYISFNYNVFVEAVLSIPFTDCAKSGRFVAQTVSKAIRPSFGSDFEALCLMALFCPVCFLNKHAMRNPRERIRNSRGYKWWILSLVMLGTFMAVMDVTVVNVGLPTIMSVFHIPISTAEWVITAYMITMTLMLPSAGWIADRIGNKRMYILGLVLFTFGSWLCGRAGSDMFLISARALQGFGSGIIQSLGLAIVTREFPPQQRGLALGLWSVAAAASISFGPLIGGYLVDDYSWHLIFDVNVPVGLAAILFAIFIQKEWRGARAGSFDWPGFLCVVCFMPLLIFALARGNSPSNPEGWSSPEVIGCFAVAAAALIVFIVRELRCENPLLNLKLLGERNFGVSMAVLAIFGIGMLGGTYLLPLYMQKGLGYTAIMAGSVFLPVGLIQGVLSTCSGFLTRYVKPLFIAVTGILVMTLSFYFASRFTLHTTHAQIMLVLYLRGFGMGLTFAPLNDFSLMNLSQCDMASAAGISNSIKQLSGSVSIALLTVILTGRTAFHSAQGGLSSAESYVAGISDDFLFVTFVSLASALPFLWLLRPRRKAASFKSEGTGT